MIRLGQKAQLQLAMAATLGWVFMALCAPHSFIKIGLSAAFLLLVPGYIMLRLIRLHTKWPSLWEVIGYSLGLSVFFLMTVGLIINTILPLLGMHTPLTVLPLTLGVGAGVLVLLLWLNKAGLILLPKVEQWHFSVPDMWLVYASALTVVLSVLGAISLNNGGTSAFTVWMLTIICLVCLVIPWLGRRLGRNAIGLGIYLMSLAMLFATSLRGWFITGHDIMQEYQVFELTSSHSLWSMNFFHDAYNACLSITILPTLLQRLTGISDPYVYKVLIQLVFAVVPVLVYMLAQRLVDKVPAALAAVVFITFPTFMMDFPMLNRQEIAFLFFALGMLALFEYGLRRQTRMLLFVLLFAGMVLSHYSTSYIAVGGLVVFKIIEMGVRAYRLGAGKRPRPLLRLSWFSVALLAGMVYVWQVPMTNTAGQAESTLSSITTSLPTLLHRSSGPNLNGQELFDSYVRTAPLTRDLTADNYYPASLTDQYTPIATKAPTAPLTSFGEVLSAIGVPIANILDAAKSLYGSMIEGLIVVGLGVLIFRKSSWRIRQGYVVMGIAFFGLIVLQVLLPSAINYGLLRLMQQSLIFLALPMLAAINYAGELARIPQKLRMALLSAVFVIGFAFTGGLVAAITGGYPQQLVAANSGFYYDAYYTHADELAGFTWLSDNMPVGSIVDSDEFTRRKMATYIGVYSRVAIAPSTIANDGYFFLSYGDTTTDSMPHYYNGTLIYQQPPTAFLQATKNLLYTNDAVQIYR